MKFPVLLYATSIVVQLTGFRFVDARSYFDEVATISSWAGCAKRFSVVSIVLSAVVLYYFPESRNYARTACNVAIDIIANTLKAALSSVFSNESCDPIEPAASHYSDRSLLGLEKVPDISDISRDRYGASNPRRRHRAKQDDDKTRGHDKKKHRNSGCSDSTREEKSRQRRSRDPDRRKTFGRASDDARIVPSRERLCRPEGRKKDESSPKFSTSFITSLGVARSNVAEARSTLERENGKDRLKMVFGRQSKPGVGTRMEDALYPENEGPVRDREDLVTWFRDSDSPRERTTAKYHELEDEISPPSVGSFCRERCKDERASTIDKDRGYEDQDEDEDENSAAFPPAEGDPSSTVDEGRFAARRVYFQRKDGDKGRKKTADADDDGSPDIGSERVLNRLGDQIAKLEMTVKMMKPESGTRKNRASSNEDEHVLRSVETLLEDMRRSFSKMDEDRPSVCSGSPVGSRANRFDYPTLDVDEEASSNQPPREEDSVVSLPKNSAAMRSETLLEYEEEIAPMMTNRVKPYLVRTFDWLFTGCPGTSSKRYSVGKDGAGRSIPERDL